MIFGWIFLLARLLSDTTTMLSAHATMYSSSRSLSVHDRLEDECCTLRVVRLMTTAAEEEAADGGAAAHRDRGG